MLVCYSREPQQRVCAAASASKLSVATKWTRGARPQQVVVGLQPHPQLLCTATACKLACLTHRLCPCAGLARASGGWDGTQLRGGHSDDTRTQQERPGPRSRRIAHLLSRRLAFGWIESGVSGKLRPFWPPKLAFATIGRRPKTENRSDSFPSPISDAARLLFFWLESPRVDVSAVALFRTRGRPPPLLTDSTQSACKDGRAMDREDLPVRCERSE